ncbi:hypothetical protein [Flavobacterium sp.]|jgi:hypothetical protein|nr:hypothetical protein [Flavobacterium sp.]MCZ8144045.1 hypothetical protein [Flavobacterium sp.]
MAYNWNVSEPKNDQKPKFEIQPEIYSIIELNGENRTYTCDFRPNKVEKYFEAKIDRNSIDSLVKGVDLLSKEYKSVIHYDSNIGCIKPLPILKIKVNYSDNTSKSYYYNFTENEKKYSSIRNLYRSLKIIEIGETYHKIDINSNLENKKIEFIKKSMKEDTTAFPKPRKLVFEVEG